MFFLIVTPAVEQLNMVVHFLGSSVGQHVSNFFLKLL